MKERGHGLIWGLRPFGSSEVALEANPLVGSAFRALEHGRLFAAMQSLPVQWQVALWHVEVLGRAQEEAAPLMGIHAGRVTELLFQAREGLRQAYDRPGTKL